MQLAFVIFDQSGSTSLTAEVLSTIAQGLDTWLNEDVAPVWGGGYVVRVASAGEEPNSMGPLDCPAIIRPSLPEAPNAAAYHSRTSAGAPVIYAALDEFSTFTEGDGALSEGLGHEFVETLVDPGANQWCDRNDSSEEAKEASDRVQGTSYVKAGVSVPNFLLPSAFFPNAPPPYDFRGVLQAQTDQTPAGYVILRRQGAELQERSRGHVVTIDRRVVVVGDLSTMSAKTLARKRNPISRTWRRGARL